MPQGNRGGIIPWWVFEPPQPLGAGATGAASRLPPDEQAAAEAIFAETRGLYPQPIDPDRPVHDRRNWDSRSHRQLTGARRSLGTISERNPDIERLDGSRFRNPLEARQWGEAATAARIRGTTDIPPDAAWFNIRNADVEPHPQRRHPSLGNVRFWRTYGPFVNVGGGDVDPGRNIMIDIYVPENVGEDR